VQHGKQPTQSSKTCCCTRVRGPQSTGLSTSTLLVEDSLNLAYHGARAEKQGFTITLERSLDPAAGQVDCFPQEITRVLLNLISNGFYAATKRKGQASNGDYEPTLAAATKNPAGLVVKKGLNILSFASGGMPVPLSRILISNRSARTLSLSWRPQENCMADVSRDRSCCAQPVGGICSSHEQSLRHHA